MSPEHLGEARSTNPSSVRDRAQARKTVLAFCAVVLFVGTNPVAIRLGVRELDPFWGAGARFAVATGLLLALLRLRGGALPRGPALIGATLFGLIGIGTFFALAYWGLERVNAGTGSVLLSLVPLLTLGLAIPQRLERFRWPAAIGGVLAVAGIVAVFAEQVQANVPATSVLALLGAAVCAAEGGIVLKRFPPTDPVATNAVAMAIGCVILITLSFVAGEDRIVPTEPETWWSFAYLGTIGTLGAFLLYLYVLRRWPASAAAYEFVAAPVVSVGLSALILDEDVTAGFFLGGLLVLAGVYIGAIREASGGR